MGIYAEVKVSDVERICPAMLGWSEEKSIVGYQFDIHYGMDMPIRETRRLPFLAVANGRLFGWAQESDLIAFDCKATNQDALAALRAAGVPFAFG